MSQQNQQRNQPPRDNTPTTREQDDAELRTPADEEERLLDEAENVVSRMEMREVRRSPTYQTGGDDQSPGIDTDMDTNGPKDLRQD